MAKKKSSYSSDSDSRNWRSGILYFLLILLAISLLTSIFQGARTIQEIPYSQFISEVNAGLVKEVAVNDENNTITGKRVDKPDFKTTKPANDPQLYQILREKGVNFKVSQISGGWVLNILAQVFLPFLLFAALWYFMFRQAANVNSQAMSFGRSRAKLVERSKTKKMTFKDVAGVDEAKEELEEIVEFLKSPEKFHALGAKIPKGVLLVGPPGTGKTLLARAIAGEADVAFFSLSGSDFVEMFVGVGASRVRDLFEQAKKQQPSIIFLDEIDAVGRHRGAGLGGGHDEREQTLNQMLVEMDGFDPKVNVIIIAATNRPDILDPALLRPGRFDRQVVLDKPDIKGREEILKIHTREIPLAAEVDLNIIARRTPGFTGADLANLANEAAILAARRGKKQISMEELEDSIERVVVGLEKKSRLISTKEKEMVAYHEVGHAIVAKSLPNTDPVHKVSILPRGMALGYTLQLPLEDKHMVAKVEIMDQLAVLLGGRVAEELVFNDVTTGAHNDLERATDLARRMVCEYGMSSLGPRTFGHRQDLVFLGRDISDRTPNYGEAIANAIDKEIHKIIEVAHDQAKEILLARREKLEKISKILMEKETIEGDELEVLFSEQNAGPLPADENPKA
jgi:cell division protease FtsH